MAKGSGMIHPNMATMLGFLTTDAAITTPMLQKALKLAVDDTFNMVSVDGDTSTMIWFPSWQTAWQKTPSSTRKAQILIYSLRLSGNLHLYGEENCQ